MGLTVEILSWVFPWALPSGSLWKRSTSNSTSC